MFDFFIITLWFELNNKLYIKHYPYHWVTNCGKGIHELVKHYEEKYPLRKLKAAKCNEPSVWHKKYKLNKWELFKKRGE